MSFQPFNPTEDLSIHRGNLPHWRQHGTTYFVTTRLADSIPSITLGHWREKRDAWLRTRHLSSPKDLDQLTEEERREYHQEFTSKFHDLLDAGHGACHLSSREIANLLATRLISGHSTTYNLDAWVIMPNHLHALVSPEADTPLGDILQHWKGGSAREINLALGLKGSLWQREAFDHIVRSEAQLHHFRRYIAENPIKASLRNGFIVGIGSQANLSLPDMQYRVSQSSLEL